MMSDASAQDEGWMPGRSATVVELVYCGCDVRQAHLACVRSKGESTIVSHIGPLDVLHYLKVIILSDPTYKVVDLPLMPKGDVLSTLFERVSIHKSAYPKQG
jgi:hypothetical protein